MFLQSENIISIIICIETVELNEAENTINNKRGGPEADISIKTCSYEITFYNLQ